MKQTHDPVKNLEMRWQLHKERKKLDKKKFFVWTISVIVFTYCIAFILFHFILGIAIVQESSMVPRLHSGEIVVYNRLDKNIQPGDIVMFYSDQMEYNCVKRVIAVGGDQIAISQGNVYINDILLEEPYLYGARTYSTGDILFPLEVPEGYLFVLGDNREVSLDSRSNKIGLVKESEILGKLVE